MIVQCERCRTKFRIADERVTDQGIKVRCSRCAHVFRVFKDPTLTGAGPLQIPDAITQKAALSPSGSFTPGAVGANPAATLPPPASTEEAARALGFAGQGQMQNENAITVQAQAPQGTPLPTFPNWSGPPGASQPPGPPPPPPGPPPPPPRNDSAGERFPATGASLEPIPPAPAFADSMFPPPQPTQPGDIAPQSGAFLPPAPDPDGLADTGLFPPPPDTGSYTKPDLGDLPGLFPPTDADPFGDLDADPSLTQAPPVGATHPPPPYSPQDTYPPPGAPPPYDPQEAYPPPGAPPPYDPQEAYPPPGDAYDPNAPEFPPEELNPESGARELDMEGGGPISFPSHQADPSMGVRMGGAAVAKIDLQQAAATPDLNQLTTEDATKVAPGHRPDDSTRRHPLASLPTVGDGLGVWPTLIGILLGIGLVIVAFPDVGASLLDAVSRKGADAVSHLNQRRLLPEAMDEFRAVETVARPYRTENGQALLVVKGMARNLDSEPQTNIAAVALMVDGDQIVARRRTSVGLVLTPQMLYGIKSEVDLLAVQNTARESFSPVEIPPNGEHPFMVVFPSIPLTAHQATFHVEFVTDASPSPAKPEKDEAKPGR